MQWRNAGSAGWRSRRSRGRPARRRLRWRSGGGGSKGTVNIAVNPWTGSTANAAVIAYLLEEKLGYTVNLKDLKEDVAWQGFETGEVDAILEIWGHPDLEKTYIDEKKVAMDAGSDGQRRASSAGTCRAGWPRSTRTSPTGTTSTSTPTCSRRPSRATWASSSATDPSYVQYDEALIDEPGPELQGRLLRQRGRHCRVDQAGGRPEEAAPPLLVGSALAQRPGQARPDQPAAVHRRLRRGPGEGRLRLPGLRPQQDHQHEVQRERRRRRDVDQELQLDERRPEHGRRLHHQRGHDRRGRPPRSGSTSNEAIWKAWMP